MASTSGSLVVNILVNFSRIFYTVYPFVLSDSLGPLYLVDFKILKETFITANKSIMAYEMI